MKSKYIEYSIYKPAGNDTAFVYGTDYTSDEKKLINDAIMAKNPNVEQVGFLNINGKTELQMAGGEFCGNATRSAAQEYLKGQAGSIKMIVNCNDIINAGVDVNGKAWCEIPLPTETNIITQKEPGIFIIKLNGMTTIVIQEDVSEKYLENRKDLKKIGMSFIQKYKLEESKAVGVIFCERENKLLKINPVVWVKSINTTFYETACGSGTTAVAILEAFQKRNSQSIDIIQPSGMIITAQVTYSKEKILKAVITGEVKKDENKYSLKI